jgi:hypothetical protein
MGASPPSCTWARLRIIAQALEQEINRTQEQVKVLYNGYLNNT